MLGMPQTASPAQYVQPQPPQQVYVTSSGQQVLLVDQGPPLLLQEGPAYAYTANASSSAQLAPVYVSQFGVLGGNANSQHSFASTEVGQGVQAAPALLNAEVPQTAAGQFMLSSNASSTPAQLAYFNTNINSSMQAIAAVGAGMPGSATVMVNQAWHNSVSLPGVSSSAVSQQQVLLGPPAYGPMAPQVAQQQLSSIGFDAGVSPGYGNAPAVSEATLAQTSWGPVPAASAPALLQGTSPAPAEGGAAMKLPAPWANTPHGGDLQHLWGNQQLLEAKGGLIDNSTERTAWPPPAVAKMSAQDLYDFRRLKHAVHSLDTVTKMRKWLVKRLHAVVDYGGGELKSVYFEVRCAISEVMHGADAHRLKDTHLRGLVRLALDLQEALRLGPRAVAAAAVAEQRSLGGLVGAMQASK